MSTTPDVSFNVLPHADGSASYAWHGYSVIGSVNGPIDPSRRDELPQEAFIEVHVRPASGLGGTRERHIESIVHSVLRSVILVQIHPRALVQLTLQILSTPETDPSAAPVPQSSSYIPLLPHLLHTALLAVLAANIPLSKVYTAVMCAVDAGGAVIPNPTPREWRQAVSVHAFVFASSGEALLVESRGSFDLEGLGRAAGVAQLLCVGDGDTAGSMSDLDDAEPLAVWLRRIVSDGVQSVSKWRGSL